MTGICLLDGSFHAFGDELPPIEVIASSLAHINRFTGHAGPYSVAQHCVLASMFIDDDTLRLSALLHDAPEAIYGDISSPLKRLLGGGALERLENHYHDAVDTAYGVQTRHPLVKECDGRLLITEAKSFGIWCEEFPDFRQYPYVIKRWPAAYARKAFLKRFEVLTK